MSAVWRFTIRYDNEVIEMPRGARLLCFDRDADNRPSVWALVDPKASETPRRFLVVGTGHDVPDGAEYVGTFSDDPFVWHLFDLGEE